MSSELTVKSKMREGNGPDRCVMLICLEGLGKSRKFYSR